MMIGAGLGDGSAKAVDVNATVEDISSKAFSVKGRIDTPNEVDYHRHGSVLHYVRLMLSA